MSELFTMFVNSVKLFLTGKLFRDYRPVVMLTLAGFAIALVLIGGIAWIVGSWVGLWVGAIVGGFVSGALMPWLFKDLKYN